MDFKSLARLFGDVTKKEGPAISKVGKKLTKQETEITKDLLREHPDLIPGFAKHQNELRQKEIKGTMDVPEVEPLNAKEISPYAEDTAPGLSTKLSGEDVVSPKETSSILDSESIGSQNPVMVGKPYNTLIPDSVSPQNKLPVPYSEQISRSSNLPIERSPRNLVSTAGDIIEDISYKDVTPKVPNSKSYEAGNKLGSIAKWVKDNPKKALAMGFTGALAGEMINDGTDDSNPSSPSSGTIKNVASVMPKTAENLKKQEAETPSTKESDNLSKSLPKTPQSLDETSSEPVQSASPMSKLFNIDFGDNTNASVANLQAAQDQAERRRQIAVMSQAGNLIGAGLSGGKANTELWDQDIRDSDRGVKDYLARQEQEKNDPASAISQGYREMMKRFGVNISGKASASAIDKIAPGLEKLYNAEEARKQKSEDNKYRNEVLKENAKDRAATKRADTEFKISQKEEQKDTDRFDRMGKLITAEISSSRGAFGKAALNKQSIENVDALLHGDANLDDIDTRQIAETARILDRVLSQGASTISGSEKLTPETARMKIAKMMEYWTNERKGAGAASFLKNMKETFEREKQLANKQVKDSQKKILAPYLDLKKKYPDRWEEIMLPHGLGEKEIDTKPEIAKTVIKKGYNPSTNQTQLIYSDGSKEIIDGRK